ncbi:major capsid protein [Microvirus sp.]|nr:major capsid protein [Microvirus sp.]
MSNRIPTKANVNIASVKPNKFDLSCKHITTTDFGLLRPVFSRMMVPADKFEVEVNTFHRLDPMVAPNNSDMDVHTRAFFVPYRTICNNFNEFIANTPGVTKDGKFAPVPIPTFSANSLLSALSDSSLGKTSNTAGDIIYRKSVSDGWKRLKLTTRGRAFYSLLLSLGYNFRFDTLTDGDLDKRLYSALPILAYIKVWLDWYVPSRFYFSDTTISTLQSLVSPNNQQRSLYSNSLLAISKALCVFFTEDYFSNCLSQPFGDNMPTVRPSVSSTVFDGSPASASVDDLKNGAVVTSSDDGSVSQFNALSIKSLGAIQAMLNRNAIVNQKLKDYIKITYGLEPNLDTFNMSHYLGSSVDQLLVGDVMSNADTLNADGSSGALLGQYAGKGLGSSNGKFTCHTPEFGLFLVLQDICPRPFYYQGVHTEHTAKDRYDFFDPTFDGVITEAVPYSRLDNTCRSDKLLQPLSDSIFGYMPSYSDYKVGYDILSGNFRMDSINNGLDSWYLAREFGFVEKTEHISLEFCDASILNPTNRFATLFYTDNSSADHIYQVHNVRCTAYRRMRSLIEQVLEDDSDRNGSVTISRQGTIADRN